MQKSAGTHFAFAEYIAAAAFAKKAAEMSDIMQRLVLPINNFKPIAGYKAEKYRQSGFGLLPSSHRQAGVTKQALYFHLRRDIEENTAALMWPHFDITKLDINFYLQNS